MDFLSQLNPAQRAAVEHPLGPLLVVAGAGSGKTRVLTARVAWLIGQGAEPASILAFTFTNRAAREMRERIEGVVGERALTLWVGTFHATAVRILRRETRTLGLPADFAIYDREDQETLVREIIKRLELPEGEYRVGMVLGRISDAKNALLSVAEVERVAASPRARRLAECYRLYQEALGRNGALDFDDLIGETVRLFRDHPTESRRYAERFHHVLVDEYQDTNHAQFRLIQGLVQVHGDLFAVGDDDQSIYGWRGASLAHMLDFEDQFPGAAQVRLEQNYRSTGTILKAANAVIANNRKRKGKNLWCDREDGAPLRFILAEDDADEARRVRAVLAQQVARGGRLSDCAVLYRTNAQSRALETELRQNLIPYEIVGGVPFYQRREVKDLLAYLRLLVNPGDQVAFWRVWNTPRRGLGAVVRAQVEALMQADTLGPLQALERLAEGGAMTRAARSGALELLSVLDELRQGLEAPVDALLRRLLERTRYLEHLEGDEDAADRKANIDELVNAAAGFAATRGGALRDFLAETALVSDADMLSESADRTLLLTAHNAKGLEFPVVVVTGLEEGLFPHANSLEKAEQLEEERRLFYVALTRGMERVVLTAAAFRRRHDGARGGPISRFIDEIPSTLMDFEDTRLRHRAAGTARGWGEERGGSGRRGGGGAGRTESASRARLTADDASEWSQAEASGMLTGAARAYHAAIGREVYHESFGRGVVLAAEADGSDVKFTVRFGTRIKKVMGRFLSEGSDGD